jgi:hypothetical protein
MTPQTMHSLSEKCFGVVLLLLGQAVLQGGLLMVFPLIPDFDLRIALIMNSFWIANTIFAIDIFFLLTKHGKRAIPISVLSVLTPVFGAIFYIITTIPNKNGNE